MRSPLGPALQASLRQQLSNNLARPVICFLYINFSFILREEIAEMKKYTLRNSLTKTVPF